MFKQYIFVKNNKIIGTQYTDHAPCPPDGSEAIEFEGHVNLIIGNEYLWKDNKIVDNGPIQIVKDYAQLRYEAYPDITDQLDLLYHRGYEGWKSYITAIKAKYPKS